MKRLCMTLAALACVAASSTHALGLTVSISALFRSTTPAQFVIPGTGDTLSVFVDTTVTDPSLTLPNLGSFAFLSSPSSSSLRVGLNGLPPGVPWLADPNPITVWYNNIGGGTYNTDLAALSLFGGSIPGGYMFRESPTLVSAGQIHLTPSGASYDVSGFFDVFLELSVDGGQTWIPRSNQSPMHMEAPPIPAPGAAALLGLGGVMFVVGRRRRSI